MLCPAAPSKTVLTVVIMSKKKAVHGVAETASGQIQRKRRRRPPWGNLLGGKPIKRYELLADEKIDLGDDFTRENQYFRMKSLLRHYGIVGHVPTYPVAGLDDSGWWRWYELALAIAS